MPLRLNFGAGHSHGENPEGWVAVDLYSPDTDLACTMWETPYPDASVDEVVSSHALEHVPMAKVIPTLKEWARVMKSGAPLTLQVPDLAWCCAEWIKNPTDGFEMMRIFGGQGREGEYHHCGFTDELLVKYLAPDFEILSIEHIETHSQQTIRVCAKRR